MCGVTNHSDVFIDLSENKGHHTQQLSMMYETWY